MALLVFVHISTLAPNPTFFSSPQPGDLLPKQVVCLSSHVILCLCSSRRLLLLTIQVSASTSPLLWPFPATFLQVAHEPPPIILSSSCIPCLFPATMLLWYALISFLCTCLYFSIITYMFHENRNLAWFPSYVFCTYNTSLPLIGTQCYWKNEWISEHKSQYTTLSGSLGSYLGWPYSTKPSPMDSLNLNS